MTNFRIEYSHPWLLLLLIPAVALTFLPYFRSSKKYRRTRNRILSMTFHLVAMVLAINLLAGIGFSLSLIHPHIQYGNEYQRNHGRQGQTEDGIFL